jgi:glycosyltransferase involved in cell wall biosynthesis
MRIIVAHNFYKQPGGEDYCVAAEVAMLRAHGHQVTEYYLHNDSIDTMSSLHLASRTIWSRPAARELRQQLRAQNPQIVHFHNTFPLISPSAYYAARSENARVIQTLHNFRLCCPNALLFRNGRVCEDCLGQTIPWHGIVHKCYRDSHVASAAVSLMLTTHRALGTWRNAIDVYIALTEFERRKLIAGGLPADKIVVKPNFAYPDPSPATGGGGYAVYVGRLSAEKGLETLLKAWRSLGRSVPLKLLGDGPMAAAVKQAVAQNAAIEWLGNVPQETVYELIGEASFLVLPSQCYETFARVIIEAFAKGTPVIVSRLGTMAEIVEDGRTGLHFAPGDSEDLAEKVRTMLANPLKLARMRQAARQTFEQKFTAAANYKSLMGIYDRAINSHSKSELQSGAPRVPSTHDDFERA